jgi:diguanylate cyclase (GGDEF)-like protein
MLARERVAAVHTLLLLRGVADRGQMREANSSVGHAVPRSVLAGRVAGRLALGGLALVLVLLAGVSVWGVAQTRGATGQVAGAAKESSLFDRARFAVASEEALERGYQLSPEPKVRVEFAATAAALASLLHQIRTTGSSSDRAIAKSVLVEHARYLVLARQLFAAVDAGNDALTLALDEEALPRVHVIEGLIFAVAATHARQAQTSLAALRHNESSVLVWTLAVFALGLCLLVLCCLVLVSSARRLERQGALTRHQALHDALTGLPNRLLLLDRGERAVAAARRTSGSVGLLLLDLDRFKDINDTLGHHQGDALLRSVAKRLASVVREADSIVRLGGDEFAVLLPQVVDAETAMGVAGRMLQALRQPFVLDQLAVEVDASIGVAVSADRAVDVDMLLQRADVAMYVAKQTHTGATLYAPELDVNNPRRLALLGDLRRAIEHGGLTLHYQPKVDLASGEVRGVEALVRWDHPELGAISPAEFVPLAEGTALIHGLTTFVLETALHQQRAWHESGYDLTMAINLSARSLLDVGFPQHISALLATHGVEPSRLVLEITESTLMTDPARAQRILHELDALGVRISIDDFGTGYSSLARLKDLPVHELKIDRAFVTRMQSIHSDAVIVRSTIDLARNLGLAVVAEGVEDGSVLNELSELGCDTAQGYYLSHPAPAHEILAWLNNQQPPQRQAPAA